MVKTIKLREWPVKEQPAILLASNWDIPTKDQVQQVFEFFKKTLGLETLRKSIEGRPYIEGSFQNKDNRMVRLRFFYKEGTYRNTVIDGIDKYFDIKVFKKLYCESPHIEVSMCQ